MRSDHVQTVKQTQEKADQDKTQMRQDYENLLAQVRADYQAQKNELREQLRKCDADLQQKIRDYNSMREEFDNRFTQLRL